MSSQPPPPPPPPSNGNPFGGPNNGYPGYQPAANVENYMVWAILTTLFCCLPFGIVSIVNASQVSKRLAMGDIAGAQVASKQAKTWAIVSAIAGAIVIGGYFLLVAGALANTSG